MKILVIGGAGYIGSHLTYELCDQGYKVTVLDNLSTGFIENVDSRSDFIQSSFNEDSVRKILKEVDCVIHLAALKAAGESMFNPIKFSQNNIINSIQLLNDCITSKVKNFIFSSSAAVYGYPNYLPIDEQHPLNPINYYGFTKLVIEKQLLWYNKIKGINIACLRYFNAAGHDINGRLTVKEVDPQNLIPIIMEVAAGIRKDFKVFGNDYNTPDGTCLRDYIHVNDLAIGHVKAVEMIPKQKKIISNLATGKYHSVLEVIKTVELIADKKINYTFDQRRAGDPDKLYASSNNFLRYEAKYSDLKTIVSSMWEIYRS